MRWVNLYSPNVTFLYPPENVRKPKVFGPFQGVQKCNIGRIWVNKVLVFYFQKNEKDDVMQPDILSSFFSF